MNLLPLLRYIPAPTLWLTLGASLLAGVANIAIIALISRRLSAPGEISSLFALQFALTVLLVVTLDFGVKWLLLRLTAGTGYRLRVGLSQRILGTPLAQLEKIGAPRLLAALTDDIHTLVVALNQVPNIATSLAILIGCIGYLTWLSPPTLLLAAGLTLPAAMGQIWVRNKARQRRAASLEARNHLFERYRMLTEGTKELKMHRARRYRFLDELLLPTTFQYENLTMQSHALHHLAASWTQALYFLFILALFVLTAAWGLKGEVLTTFALVALYARTSLNGLFTVLPILNDAGVAVHQLEGIGVHLTENPPERANETIPAIPPVALELIQVGHTYRMESAESNFHLGPIDLKMASGELIFLIGGNGSGKTTLAKLLLGLYTPDGGRIEWNGRPVTAANIDDYRQLFSVVFADFFLFDQLLGLKEIATDAQARAYLQKLQLAHKVEAKEGRFSTLDLSTGQRQRLALLTAYLEDRPVYLFDEWAAGQDPQFKEIFYHQLLPELRGRGKLVIVISHDDHYYSVADRVVKLDFGKIEYDEKRE